MVIIHSNSNDAFYALECVRVRGMCARLIAMTREYEFVGVFVRERCMDASLRVTLERESTV